MVEDKTVAGDQAGVVDVVMVDDDPERELGNPNAPVSDELPKTVTPQKIIKACLPNPTRVAATRHVAKDAEKEPMPMRIMRLVPKGPQSSHPARDGGHDDAPPFS